MTGGPELVLVCALSVLGRSEKTFPRVELIATVPADVSPRADAFVRQDGAIYLVTSSAVFRNAALDIRDRCESTRAIKKIASILVHEEWHVRHGPEEQGAYYAQLTALSSLGLPQDSILHWEVHQAMRAVQRARQRPKPERLLAQQ